MVNNVKDLELLLMHNRKYCAEIAHNVSTLKRKAIVERAAEVRSGAAAGAAWQRQWQRQALGAALGVGAQLYGVPCGAALHAAASVGLCACLGRVALTCGSTWPAPLARWVQHGTVAFTAPLLTLPPCPTPVPPRS